MAVVAPDNIDDLCPSCLESVAATRCMQCNVCDKYTHVTCQQCWGPPTCMLCSMRLDAANEQLAQALHWSIFHQNCHTINGHTGIALCVHDLVDRMADASVAEQQALLQAMDSLSSYFDVDRERGIINEVFDVAGAEGALRMLPPYALHRTRRFINSIAMNMRVRSPMSVHVMFERIMDMFGPSRLFDGAHNPQPPVQYLLPTAAAPAVVPVAAAAPSPVPAMNPALASIFSPRPVNIVPAQPQMVPVNMLGAVPSAGAHAAAAAAGAGHGAALASLGYVLRGIPIPVPIPVTTVTTSGAGTSVRGSGTSVSPYIVDSDVESTHGVYDDGSDSSSDSSDGADSSDDAERNVRARME